MQVCVGPFCPVAQSFVSKHQRPLISDMPLATKVFSGPDIAFTGHVRTKMRKRSPALTTSHHAHQPPPIIAP